VTNSRLFFVSFPMPSTDLNIRRVFFVFHICVETSTLDIRWNSTVIHYGYAGGFCFRRKRWILPDSVFGSASVKTTERGYL